MVTELGKPLSIQHLPVQSADSGEVKVSIKCAAVNFADILQSQGKYQNAKDLPFVAGR
jgi:NADPH2:quinone reductase